jgi:hypothetical protein
MDPDANLAEQRKIVARLLDDNQRKDDYGRAQDANRLAELVQALDEWLTRGGFLPPSWGKHWRGVRS